MTTPKQRQPLHPLGALGLIAWAAGMGAWLWLGDWRWAVTGILALLVLGTLGAVVDSRKQHTAVGLSTCMTPGCVVCDRKASTP